MMTVFAGVLITLITSIFINRKMEESIQVKNIESIHKSLRDILKSSIEISDFAEVQRNLGLINNGDRKFGIFLKSGEWVLADYEFQNLFEATTIKSSNLCGKSNFGINGSFCSILSDRASLVSIEIKVTSFIEQIKPNLIVLLLLFTAMIAIGFIGSHLLNRRILKPFAKLHQDLIGLTNSRLDLTENHQIFENREFKELQNIAISVNDLLSEITKTYEELQKRENAVLFSQIASQVSHDLKSPLSAMKFILTQMDSIPETQRILLRTSINRVNDIANELLNHSKNKSDPQLTNNNNQLESTMLASLIDSVVSEKRVSLRDKGNIQIEARLEKSYGLFSKINPIEMKRLLSNAITNAVEACDKNFGLVEIILVESESQIILIVQDNGKGIPPEVVNRLGLRGVTHGKEGTESGHGLGVYHAKKTIESFGGKFEIQSSLGVGTKVIMTLEKDPAPEWFVHKLMIFPGQYIVATDDDQSVLEIYKQRFAPFLRKEEVHLITCSSGNCVKEWIRNYPEESQKAIFLFDYELLGQLENGLDLIESLDLKSRSILVSSRYEEIAIRERCSKLSIRMIPKGMTSLVPIEIEK